MLLNYHVQIKFSMKKETLARINPNLQYFKYMMKTEKNKATIHYFKKMGFI